MVGDEPHIFRFPGVTLGNHLQVLGLRNVTIGPGTCVGDGVWVCAMPDAPGPTRLEIGRCVIIGRYSMLNVGEFVEIGSHTLIGPGAYIGNTEHGYADVTRPVWAQRMVRGKRLVIEENCWLGTGVVVAGDRTIGRGSVLGAGSVVVDDVPPFAVVVGNPARVVKMYDFAGGAWKPIRSTDDLRTALAGRERHPPPDRAAYRATLDRNAPPGGIPPVFAGKGIHL